MQGRPRDEVREYDQTTSISTPSLFPIGVVGFAEKGPINVPTLVTNMQQFTDTFGARGYAPEVGKSFASYALDAFFREGNTAYFVRGPAGDLSACAFAALYVQSGAVSASTSASYTSGISLSNTSATTATAGELYVKMDATFAASALTGAFGQAAASALPSLSSIPDAITTAFAASPIAFYAKSQGSYANSGVYIGILNFPFFNMAMSARAGKFTSAYLASCTDADLSGATSAVFLSANGTIVGPTLNYYPQNPDEFYVAVYSSAGTVLEDFVASLNPTRKDGAGNSLYVLDRINLKSKYLSATLSPNFSASVVNGVAGPDFINFVSGGYSLWNYARYAPLMGGKYEMSAADLDDLAEGVSAFYNKNEYSVRCVSVPGATWTDGSGAVSEAVAVATTRADCYALVDMPRENVQATVATRYSCGIDNTYTRSICNWFQYYDSYNDKYVYLPPSVQALRLHALTYNRYGFFYAPAGRLRGQLQNVVQLDYKLTDGEMDILSNSQIDYLTKLPAEGYVLWGQKTTYSLQSDFRDMNVRMLFIEIERAISNMARGYIFDQNDALIRGNAKITIEGFLQSIKNQRGIEDFLVICDSSNNPEAVVSDNTLVIDIFIKATKVAELIKLNFTAVRDLNQVTITRG